MNMMNETNSKATETETPDRTEETTMAKAIGLWIDSTGGSTPVWIVSLDTLDADGNAEHSKTIGVYDDSEGGQDDAEDEAREFALAEAARLELPCIQTERDGSRTTISE